jgi:hypothetical protein
MTWDCYQSLAKLTERNRIKLMWVPGHRGIEDDEIADEILRLGFACPLIGPEPGCGISAGIAKKTVGGWTKRYHKNARSP